MDNNTSKIPKRVFFFWGNNTMSWMRYMTLYSFRKMNPDWEMILYYCEDDILNEKTWKSINVQDFHTYNGDDYSNRLNDLNVKIVKWKLSDNKIMNCNLKMSPSQLGDFFKWSKLDEEGGIYSDLDIIYFRPMDKLYDTLNLGGYDTGIVQTNYLSIGLIASRKTNSFYRDIFINAVNNFTTSDYQSSGVNNIYNLYSGINPHDILNEAKKKYKDLNFYNMPMDLVYYLDSTVIERAMSTPISVRNFPDNSIGYHWYGGHPISQKYNSLLNEKNYKNYSITFSIIAEYVYNLYVN